MSSGGMLLSKTEKPHDLLFSCSTLLGAAVAVNLPRGDGGPQSASTGGPSRLAEDAGGSAPRVTAGVTHSAIGLALIPTTA